MSLTVISHAKRIEDCMCELIHLRIVLTVIKFFDNDNAFFIYCCDEIFALATKETLYTLHGAVIFFLRHLKDHNHTAHICFNMKFLRTIINIYKKQVVKKQVLDETVFVETFFIGYDQILYLECCQLTYHISIFIITMSNQNVL